jgi:hypothetical protein
MVSLLGSQLFTGTAANLPSPYLMVLENYQTVRGVAIFFP